MAARNQPQIRREAKQIRRASKRREYSGISEGSEPAGKRTSFIPLRRLVKHIPRPLSWPMICDDSAFVRAYARNVGSNVTNPRLSLQNHTFQFRSIFIILSRRFPIHHRANRSLSLVKLQLMFEQRPTPNNRSRKFDSRQTNAEDL